MGKKVTISIFILLLLLVILFGKKAYYGLKYVSLMSDSEKNNYDSKTNRELYQVSQKLCDYNLAESCYMAGLGAIRYRDLENAEKYLEIACEEGNDLACEDLKSAEKKIFLRRDIPEDKLDYISMLIQKGSNELGDNKTGDALKTYSEACSLNDYESCDFASRLVESSDQDSAENFSLKGCHGGFEKSCFRLGRLYFFKKQNDKASEYFKKACDQGLKEACANQ